MKTDTQLHTDVLDELKWDPRVAEAEIGIAARGGVVTLTGTVESCTQKSAAARAVRRVGGVRVLADDLEVRIPGAWERSDTEIAHQVANALAWHAEVPDGAVTARVEHGWVWLDGAVDWQYQRLAADRATRCLTGVKGVTNTMTLKSRASTRDVSQRITAALHRNAQAEAQQIAVATADGRVTLTGTVRTAGERRDAARAAWGAVGVTSVDDRLVVAPS